MEITRFLGLSTLAILCTFNSIAQSPTTSEDSLNYYSSYTPYQSQMIGDKVEGYFMNQEDFMNGVVTAANLETFVLDPGNLYVEDETGDYQKVDLKEGGYYGYRINSGISLSDYRIIEGKTYQILLRGKINVYSDGGLWIKKSDPAMRTSKYWNRYLLLFYGTKFDGTYAFSTVYLKGAENTPKWKCYFESEQGELLQYTKVGKNAEILDFFRKSTFVYNSAKSNKSKGYINRFAMLFMHAVMYNNHQDSL